MISMAICSTLLTPPAISPRLQHSTATMSGSYNLGVGYLPRPANGHPRCWKTHTTSKPNSTGGNNEDDLDFPITEWYSEDDLLMKDVWRVVNEVKQILRSMGDGEISISAYDTAWVALVQSQDGNDRPQFPSSLQWIVNNQLDDGSWGDDIIFSSHDRMINTLACVIALKSWGICHEGCERGLLFLRENLWRLAEEADELMPIAFEITFPSLVDIAMALGLQLPFDDPALQNIYAKRRIKQERIPKELMHEAPTTLLHSLEGMQDLDWSKLVNLQSVDGSFLFSPSSTAYALMRTGNEMCFKYLQRVVKKFSGGVPNVYPVDLFEHMWTVDRLERLGISRYFEAEIKDCLDYVYKYWTNNGLCWARNSSVADVDDTAMGFRLLRLHGYDVSPDAFENFEMDGEFFCMPGQVNHAVTGMYNLNRASQLMFPNENILRRAKSFSYNFLREKQAANRLVDKWIITKDLTGEVEYALDFPFYASLPRIETRWYIEQYGGASDVWIGKTLYRMPLVNNDLYLDLAKVDFNHCQAIHQREWLSVQKWHEECNLGVYGLSKKSLLQSYFLAAASIYESDRATERLGWAKTAILSQAISSYFRSKLCTEETKQDFVREFRNGTRQTWKGVGEGLVGQIHQLIDVLTTSITCQRQQPCNQQINRHLKHAWDDWMSTWSIEEDGTGMLLVRTTELCKGETNLTAQPDYSQLAQLTSSICNKLQHWVQASAGNINDNEITGDNAIEAQMQELAKCVLLRSDGLCNETKKTFLYVAKSYYYAAHCSPAVLSSHITKVLFERVE